MKILYLAAHAPWPLTTGARLRDYHLARGLAQRASVTYAGVRNAADPEDPPAPADAGFVRTVMLTKDRSYTVAKVLRGVAGPTPVNILNFWSKEMYRQLGKILEDGQFDTVQVEAVHFAPYLDLIRQSSSRPAIVSDWHNIESEIMWRYSETASFLRKLVARRTADLLERTERRILDTCAACTVASDREQQKVREMFGKESIVVPNGVAVEAYSPGEIQSASARSGVVIDAPYLLFVGSMDYHANIDGISWFASTAWPELRSRFPGLKLVIAGRDPAPQVRALEAPDVIITGTVPDVRPYYGSASAVVVPLRVGSGTRLKILEAMAAQVPVISTRLGAEGIAITPDRNIVLADTADQFIAAVERILKAPETGKAIASAARQLAEERYDWASIGTRLYAVHESLVRHPSALR